MQQETRWFKSVRRALGFVGFLLGTFSYLLATSQESIPTEVLAYADIVFYNGRILTVDDEFSVAQALAIRDGKILAVGDDSRILKMSGPATKKFDLVGRTVIPGMVEIHTGFFLGQGPADPRGPLGAVQVDLSNLEKGLESIQKAAVEKKTGEWLFIYCTPHENVNKLTLEGLDQAVPNNPLVITPHSADLSVINSQTIRLLPANIDTTPGFVKNAEGKFTGFLTGWAGGVLRYETVPWPDLDQLLPQQEDLLRYAASWGLSTLGGRYSGQSLTMIRKLQDQKKLSLRIRAVLELYLNPILDRMLMRFGNLTGLGDEWFRITGGTVVPPDGNERWGTAYTLKRKLKFVEGDNKGPFGPFTWREGVHPQDDWRQKSDYRSIITANRFGWNITEIHAKGDAAFEELLNAYRDADQVNSIKGRRFGAVHNLMRTPEQIKEAAKYQLHLSVGMDMLFLSRDSTDALKHQYGADAVHRMLPVKSMIDAGLEPTLEHPYLAERLPNAYMTMIETLVTRENQETGEIWGPDQKITREQALRMATIWPARYHGSEHEIGSLEPGKLADLVILGGDFLKVADNELHTIPVLVTIVGGKVAYDRDALLGQRITPSSSLISKR